MDKFKTVRLSRKFQRHYAIFQLYYLRMMNTIALSAPSGIAIDINQLKNVSIGKNKLSPLEIIKILNQSGQRMYSATEHRKHKKP